MLQSNSEPSNISNFYRLAGAGAGLAMAANVLDVVLGFGETELIINGTWKAVDWFELFRENWFKGLYVLGILNIAYMTCMIPVYVGFIIAHRQTNLVPS